MTDLFEIDSHAPPELASSLAAFESEFRYPMGAGRWFRISHGDDYTKFFRAIGSARTFIACVRESIEGVISVARCELSLPTVGQINAVYIADLKMRQPPIGTTLLRLLREVTQWGQSQACNCGFSIVMDGTSRLPTSYTGRLGIPVFSELAKILILRVPASSVQRDELVQMPTVMDVRRCFANLSADGVSITSGNPHDRSRSEPLGLILRSGGACGVLEDTMQCKRLFDQDGNEMLSAHLSNFGYRSPQDAVRLIQSATFHCHLRGFPAMFVAIPAVDGTAILTGLGGDSRIIQAPATVFGSGLPDSLKWYINTAEI